MQEQVLTGPLVRSCAVHPGFPHRLPCRCLHRCVHKCLSTAGMASESVWCFYLRAALRGLARLARPTSPASLRTSVPQARCQRRRQGLLPLCALHSQPSTCNFQPRGRTSTIAVVRQPTRLKKVHLRQTPITSTSARFAWAQAMTRILCTSYAAGTCIAARASPDMYRGRCSRAGQ